MIFYIILFGQNTIYTALIFLLACLVISVTGIQLAIATFLKKSEKKLGKIITIRDNI
jgi:hypothetical protein